MIKLVHVLSDMKIGGAGRWLLNLLKDIDKEAFEITVILPKGSLLIDHMKALKVQVIEVNGIFDKSFDLNAVKHFYSIFKQVKPDIVHTHASLSARIGARLAGVKVSVNTKHCMDYPKSGIKKTIDAWLNMRLSDRYIAVSEAVRQNMIASGIHESKVQTVYGGVSPLVEKSADEKHQLRKKWNIEADDIVIGIVARLTEVKGHTYFIEAAEKICKQYQHVKFLIAGAGPAEASLKLAVQKLGLEDKVIFTGFIEKVEDIFNIIDINVISSVSEALCLSLIEGMSLEKCCIGTSTGGVTEVICDGQNGYVVPIKDSEGLAGKMKLMIEEKALREKMGRAGLEIMKAKFSSEQMTRTIEKIYKELVSAGGKR